MTDTPAPQKAKAPPLESLPFAEFIATHYLPALTTALAKRGINDLDLKFADQKVEGKWAEGLKSFIVYFAKEDINAQKGFSCDPSTIEPFLVDERKSTLDLLVFGVVQRLHAQKWLLPN